MQPFDTEKWAGRIRPTLLPATLSGQLYYANWSKALATGGVPGLMGEAVKAAAGFSAWPFFVQRHQGWDKAHIVALLEGSGIPTWGWCVSWEDEYSFQVKMRQARWAQYVMLRAGVPVAGRLLAGSRAGVGIDFQVRQEQEAQGRSGQRPVEGGMVGQALAALNGALDRLIARLTV